MNVEPNPLNKSQALFENLFEYNPAALAISRLNDSVIVKINEAFLNLIDADNKSDVLGKTAEQLRIIVNPEERVEIVRLLNDDVKVVHLEGRLRTLKGDIKWMSLSIIKALLDDEPCLMAVLIDITARKVAEDKLKTVNESLEKLIDERTKEMMETEMEYQSVVEQASDGIFISDEKGKYTDVNSSACRMLGYSKEEFLQLSTTDLLMPSDVKQNPPRMSELKEGKTILSLRNLRRKDGSILPVEINAKMLSSGKMLGMVRDITERKKAEEQINKMNAELEEKVTERTRELELKIQQLYESEEKFQKAFHASSAGVTITRISDSTYMDANEAFLKMIGYARDEVIGHNSAELGIVIDMKRREEVLQQMREQGSVKHAEFTIKRKSGEHREILSSIETIVHNNENYAINIIYDITERKREQEKLEAVNKELEAFSYSVSHDLRAPLRSIMGYTGIIQEDFRESLDDQVQQYLVRIKNSASKMGRLIDDLLEFSKLGKQELITSAIDTRILVDKNIAELEIPGKAQPTFIIHDLLSSLGDFSMLSQVWFNLVSNAIKYSSKREDPVIEIGSSVLPNETLFYIKDNGVGFNMDFSSKLFGVFQRLHHPKEFEGTGVGLALVKRIIDKHGGRIWAESESGKGATFYFTLPTK